MSFELPRLPPGMSIATADGRPTLDFSVYWEKLVNAIEGALTTIDETLTNIIDLNDLITSANEAIADAEAAIADANIAIAGAEAAAAAAQTAADDVTSAQELGTSYVSGATITGSDAGANATITISAHTRHYPQPDGSTVDVSVNGGAVTGLTYSTYYYVYYDDPARAGGAVSYSATTSETVAAQLGDRHVAGGTDTPAALGADEDGRTIRPPGSGTINL